MTPRASLPGIQARFRTGETDRLASGLKIIICERAGHIATGHSKNEAHWIALAHRRPSNACFDPEMSERILELWTRLCALQAKDGRSHRCSLHAVDIWVLALAMRLASHQDRHHGPTGKSKRRLRKRSRLLGKLDRIQRRARRTWLRSSQAGLYASYRSRWKKHELWVRTYYGCLCQQPPLVPSRHRLWVKRGIEVAREALVEAEIQAPAERELRRMVRLAFSEIRRGRHPYCIADILLSRETARSFLSHFIHERLRKSGQLNFAQ